MIVEYETSNRDDMNGGRARRGRKTLNGETDLYADGEGALAKDGDKSETFLNWGVWRGWQTEKVDESGGGVLKSGDKVGYLERVVGE